MSPVNDPLFRAVEFLRAAPEPAWNAIADRVIAAIRATPRAGGQPLLAQTPPDRSGSGRIFVSDHVLRSALAVELRQRFLCAPTRIDFDIDTTADTLQAVHIHVTGSYGTPLHELATHIRATTIAIITDLLGNPTADHGPIDITITDIVTGDPLIIQ